MAGTHGRIMCTGLNTDDSSDRNFFYKIGKIFDGNDGPNESAYDSGIHYRRMLMLSMLIQS